ncbi:hypothetical protein [Vibrio gazogenes]|uniref:Uncharacterized protein n=1 Tax=Vibrio gazogenes DSM 21264 = NBRC 103151 TaxID=1123492 RepID=A0A1M4TDL0_VIBGA|nr:hypothetical protein [Vibrio gazogenes]USP16068.1 hypothetical protein MKS89_16925 [Vibrio gazogenes]SHE42377.1 hypothetical protein SAMN02745781_00289 [Vibrio gazogenes DSM 21264] [Vibrio gazogenes DSM 21264 = NBRC 103151]SJN54263.1 hypothetical protein BQ6471_00914 [Vibrio gazogenes]
MRIVGTWWMLCMLLFSTPCIAEQFAVITKANTLPLLTDAQVKMLYRGRLTHINGTHVQLADLPANSTIRTHFYHRLLGKSPTQMQAIRARQSFSGKFIPPYELYNEDMNTISQWLDEHPNGIVYIPQDWLSDQVRILYRLGDEDSL